MNLEYFTIALSTKLNLAIPLENMGAVISIEMTDICTVPGIADFWHGAVNFKGSLLWVLDTNYFFNLPSKQSNIPKKLTGVIVKQHQNNNSHKIALITSKLKGIVSFDSQQLEPIDNNRSYSWTDCCSSVIENLGESTYILNSQNLLEQLREKSDLITV